MAGGEPGDSRAGAARRLGRARQGLAEEAVEAGWCGIAWPAEYGGRGASLIQQIVFQEEIARAQAPLPINLAGLTMGGPVLIAHGTEQKRRHLQRILAADEI